MAGNTYFTETKKLKSEETKGPVDVEEKNNSSDLPEGGKEKTIDPQLPTCEGDAKVRMSKSLSLSGGFMDH